MHLRRIDPGGENELMHLCVRDLHPVDATGVAIQRVVGEVELRIAGGPRQSVKVTQAEPVRRLEPARLQSAEMIVMEHRLPPREPSPGSGRNVVAEPARGGAQSIPVIVDRPAEVVSRHEQMRRFRPPRRASRNVCAEGEPPKGGPHPRKTSR